MSKFFDKKKGSGVRATNKRGINIHEVNIKNYKNW